MRFEAIERIQILPGPHVPVGIGRANAYRATGISDYSHDVIVKSISDERLAAELLCTTLARALGINTPRPFLAEVEEGHAIAFASEAIRYGQSVFRLDDEMVARLVNEPWHPAAAALDIWVGIEDRIPANLIAIGKRFAIIDYDDGFQRLHEADTPTRGELARLGGINLSEFDRQRRLRNMEHAILGKSFDWEELRIAMPNNLSRSLAGWIDRYIQMLQERRSYLGRLFRVELNIRQSDLFARTEGTHHERHGRKN